MRTYTATTVPTQFVEASGISFAYRRWGKQSGLPLVFNQHFTGNLDNWDPAVLDGLAKKREVIIFNNAVLRVRPGRCRRPLQAWRRTRKLSSMASDRRRSIFLVSRSAE